MKKSSQLYANYKNRFINTSLPGDDNNNVKIDLEDGLKRRPVHDFMSNVPESNSQQAGTMKEVSGVSEKDSSKGTLKVVSVFNRDNQKINNIETTCNEKMVPYKKKKLLKKHSYIVNKNQLIVPFARFLGIEQVVVAQLAR